MDHLEWYSAKEVCAVLRMDPRTFRSYVSLGFFPRGVRRGKRMLIWSHADVQAMMWLEANRHRMRASKPKNKQL